MMIKTFKDALTKPDSRQPGLFGGSSFQRLTVDKGYCSSTVKIGPSTQTIPQPRDFAKELPKCGSFITSIHKRFRNNVQIGRIYSYAFRGRWRCLADYPIVSKVSECLLKLLA